MSEDWTVFYVFLLIKVMHQIEDKQHMAQLFKANDVVS